MKLKYKNTWIMIEKGDCQFCGQNCEGEHGFSDEEGFVNVCDNCLNDILAKEVKGGVQ